MNIEVVCWKRKLYVISCLIFVLILVACSKEEAEEANSDISSDSKTEDPEDSKITKEFLEENAKFISYEEVRGIFGEEDYSEPIDGTITWLLNIKISLMTG